MGGLAFFLYGMKVMSEGLEKIADGKLEVMLKKLTGNKFKALIAGFAITALIQSSSSVTVMLVGLVNSGIMTLGQTIGVIMGSNIGTTVTSWLLTLSGIESGNVFLRLLKPESFSPVLAFIGILFVMTAKSSKKRDIGTTLIGFAVLMFGMNLMSDSVKPISELPIFGDILTTLSNPIFGIIAGAIITAIIQSSSASVGILQALAITGSLSWASAIPIILGQNIGTCITAFIACLGTNKESKRVAMIHVLFNIIGTLIFSTIFYLLDFIFGWEPMLATSISALGIATFHTIFNVFSTAVLIPFSSKLEKIACILIKGKGSDKAIFIDDRLLSTPTVAVSECNNKVIEMLKFAQKSILSSIKLLKNYSSKENEQISEYEKMTDIYEDKISTFLLKLSAKNMTDSDNAEVSKMLHTIGDAERLGDHASNLSLSGLEIFDKKIKFSTIANAELELISSAIIEIVDMTIIAYENNDIETAVKIEPLEQVIDGLISSIKYNHVTRLKQGDCTIEMGFILSNILANYERISDHCSNIAGAIIETSRNSFSVHEYLNKIKHSHNENFESQFNYYNYKYNLADTNK